MERRSEGDGRPALQAGLEYYRRSVIAGAPVAAPNRPTAQGRHSGGMYSSRTIRTLSVEMRCLRKCWQCHRVKVFVAQYYRSFIRTAFQWNGADGKIVQSERSREFDFHANSYWGF